MLDRLFRARVWPGSMGRGAACAVGHQEGRPGSWPRAQPAKGSVRPMGRCLDGGRARLLTSVLDARRFPHIGKDRNRAARREDEPGNSLTIRRASPGTRPCFDLLPRYAATKLSVKRSNSPGGRRVHVRRVVMQPGRERRRRHGDGFRPCRERRACGAEARHHPRRACRANVLRDRRSFPLQSSGEQTISFDRPLPRFARRRAS